MKTLQELEQLRPTIERFFYEEAKLLDEGRFEEWLDLWTEDCLYWLPVTQVLDGGPTHSQEGEWAYYEEDKPFLRKRVERLRTGLAHAEEPASRTRHFISNVLVEKGDDTHLTVSCNILVHQSRRENLDTTYVGRRVDELRWEGGRWKIARRAVYLDQRTLPRTLSIFF